MNKAQWVCQGGELPLTHLCHDVSTPRHPSCLSGACPDPPPHILPIASVAKTRLPLVGSSPLLLASDRPLEETASGRRIGLELEFSVLLCMSYIVW
jgi:hypothetical protein